MFSKRNLVLMVVASALGSSPLVAFAAHLNFWTRPPIVRKTNIPGHFRVLEWSRDGKLLYLHRMMKEKPTIEVWNTKPRKLLYETPAGGSTVYGFVVSQNNRYFAWRSHTEQVFLFETQTSRRSEIDSIHPNARSYLLCFSPNEELLAVGQAGITRLIKCSTRMVVKQLDYRIPSKAKTWKYYPAYFGKFSRQGNEFLQLVDRKRELVVVAAQKAKPHRTLGGIYYFPRWQQLPDGRHLVAYSSDQRLVGIWDMQTAKRDWAIKVSRRPAEFHVASNGRWLIIRQDAQRPKVATSHIQIWNLKTRKKLTELNAPDWFVYSFDSRYLALTDIYGYCCVWDLENERLLWQKKVKDTNIIPWFSADGQSLWIKTIPHGPDGIPGRSIFDQAPNGWVDRLNVRTGNSRLTKVWKGHSVEVVNYQYPSRYFALVTRRDGVDRWQIEICDNNTGVRFRPLKFVGERKVEFSEDGNSFMTYVRTDYGIRKLDLWDLRTGSKIK